MPQWMHCVVRRSADVMTTSGLTTNGNVDDRDVNITASYDDDEQATSGVEEADAMPDGLPADVEDVRQPAVALPPDGGWGWVVVAAAFVSNLIVGGICYMFGIIMPELIEYFQSGKGKTAFVGSLVPGTLSVVGKSISYSMLSPLQYSLLFCKPTLAVCTCSLL